MQGIAALILIMVGAVAVYVSPVIGFVLIALGMVAAYKADKTSGSVDDTMSIFVVAIIALFVLLCILRVKRWIITSL